MELKDVIATSGSICTILQFFTGILVCQKYVQNGTTGDESVMPFIAGFLSCSMWLRYGFLLEDKSLIIVNTIGTSLQLAYVLTFSYYTLQKKAVLKHMIGAIVILGTMLLYAVSETDTEKVKSTVGLLCCLVTVLFFAAPLSMLAHVLRTKSVETLPFPMIAATLVVCLHWLIYGMLLKNSYILIPNCIGTLLSLFELSLYLIYPT